ncbi:alpha/beta hydrolase [Formosa algae]|uniref:Acetyl esterase/lipase n=1 Tax=Formosa algae TaxID=225843 RepID=A0A9X0YNB7_9FLAO|nr:alpha/beta hydrolase [Formosa algae]MBP1840494.1 acetyl esterase/lipase [Formosa algae]MDQ0336093.1 acetyl esterase/lipase [Formosa algae]OEI81026.1 1,4-beta-xylanase [Formosa algae]
MSKFLYFQDAETIPLWKTKIPNEISNSDYKELPVYKENLLVSTSHVSTPTLTIFQPKFEKPNQTGVLIFPGGGYSRLSIDKEGFKIGKWLSSIGITAFVLKYRLPSDVIMEDKTIGPLQDAQEAMRYVRENVKRYNLNIDKIGVLGFSAGGHLAATLSNCYNDVVYKSNKTSAKPNFLLLIYPVISMEETITHKGSKSKLLGISPCKSSVIKHSAELHIDKNSIMTFIVHASDDLSVPVENSLKYYLALKKQNVSAELHVFEKGGHGFGLCNDKTNLHWKNNCQSWLKLHGFL